MLLTSLLVTILAAASVSLGRAILVTEAYIRHLYARYGAELHSAALSTNSVPTASNNNTLYCSHLCQDETLFGELMYMQMRDTGLRNVLELGVGNDLSTAFWALLALQRTGGTTKLYFAFEKDKDAASRVNAFRDRLAPNVQVEYLELATVLQPTSFAPLLSMGIDGLIVDVKGLRPTIIKNVIEPLLLTKKIEDAGLQVFFHVLEQRSSKQNSPEHHTFIQWMREATKHSIDITMFDSPADLEKIQTYRKKHVTNAFPVPTTHMCPFALTTLVPEPRVTIILPVSRHHMLPIILRTMRFNLVHELIVVHSKLSRVTTPTLAHYNNSKITELFNTDRPGIYGNPERNIALSHIPKDRRGWLYFLDDDNLMHPNFWMVLQTQAVRNIILLGAEHCPDYNRDRYYMPIECRIGKVDTGNALISTQVAIKRTWVDDQISDGPYITGICNLERPKVLLLHTISAYYNAAMCDDVVLEPEIHSRL